MKVDSAVLQALRLDPEKASVASHGGSGFSSTLKITGTLQDGTKKHFFMKTGHGKDAEIMFAGEHASLNALHMIPSLCPHSFAHGRLADSPGGSFLVTDFLDMRSNGSSSAKQSGMSLAAKLAKLHTTPAPIPEGYSKPVFGFPVPTCCGSSEQENDYTESWANFYAKHRLLAILRQSESNNGKDGALRSMVERTANEVVPRLIGGDHLNSGKGVQRCCCAWRCGCSHHVFDLSVLTGAAKLWSGNKGHGVIGGEGAVEDVVFDPSALLCSQ